MPERWFHGSAMASGVGNSPIRRSSALTTIGRGQEVRELTASRVEVVAASRKASTAWVDGGGGWREKEGAGEDECGQLKVKLRN